MREAIARTIRRLNLHSVVMALPVFGQALYDGLSAELNRVCDFKDVIKSAVVPNVNMDHDTIDDYESKYGIITDELLSDNERIGKIIERAGRNGNGGTDWLQQQIRLAGFDLYVIENRPIYSNANQYGDFQFGNVQYGGEVTYKDPRNVPGKIMASSPTGNIGGQFIQYGDFQFGSSVQFGTIEENTVYPQPNEFTIPSTDTYWGYVFFISPFPDRFASEIELLSITSGQLKTLRKLVYSLKHLRNWAVVQVTTSTLQDKTTSDGFIKKTSDGAIMVVSSDLTEE